MPSADISREASQLVRQLKGLPATSVEAQEIHKRVVELLTPSFQGTRWGLLRSSGSLIFPSDLGTLLAFAFLEKEENHLKATKNRVQWLMRIPLDIQHMCDYIQVVSPQYKITRIIKDRTGHLRVGDEPWPNAEIWRPLLGNEEISRKSCWEFLLEEHD